MKARFLIFAAIAATLLLLLIVLSWYASENFSGRFGGRLMGLGDFVIWPGRIADAMLSGNLGGFGGGGSARLSLLGLLLLVGAPPPVSWLGAFPPHSA